MFQLFTMKWKQFQRFAEWVINNQDAFVACEEKFQSVQKLSIEFFRIEFCRIYKNYRKLPLVVLKMKFTKNSLVQILQILWNTIFSNFENENC